MAAETRLLRGSRCARSSRLHYFGDFARGFCRNIVLEPETVGHQAIEFSCPEQLAVPRTDKLYRHANLAMQPLHSPLQYVVHVSFAFGRHDTSSPRSPAH